MNGILVLSGGQHSSDEPEPMALFLGALIFSYGESGTGVASQILMTPSRSEEARR